MEAKQIKESIDQMLAGMTGLISTVEAAAKQSFEAKSADEAIGFANALKALENSGQIQKVKDELEELKKSFNKI